MRKKSTEELTTQDYLQLQAEAARIDNLIKTSTSWKEKRRLGEALYQVETQIIAYEDAQRLVVAY